MAKARTPKLTHVDAHGRASMVDVTAKATTERSATARATLRCTTSTRDALLAGTIKKGEAAAVARVAGVLAAKRTDELIPLCHSLPLSDVQIEMHAVDAGVEIEATAKTVARTGVEMEAMVAVSIAALTLYDMGKGVERAMTITDVLLVRKQGGKTGTWIRGDGEKEGPRKKPRAR